VLGHVDAEEPGDADRERAVAREVEEEVRAERVHVLDRRERPRPGRERPQRVAVDQVGEDELVEDSLRDAVEAGLDVVQVVASAARQGVELAREAAKGVDRAGADRRDEQQVAQEARRERRPRSARVYASTIAVLASA